MTAQQQLEKIKTEAQFEPFSNKSADWLISELEKAWTEVERLQKKAPDVILTWASGEKTGINDTMRIRAEAAEDENKRLREALEDAQIALASHAPLKPANDMSDKERIEALEGYVEELERRANEVDKRLSMPVRDGHPIWIIDLEGTAPQEAKHAT